MIIQNLNKDLVNDIYINLHNNNGKFNNEQITVRLMLFLENANKIDFLILLLYFDLLTKEIKPIK